MSDSNGPVGFVCGKTEDESGGIFSLELATENGTIRRIAKTGTPMVTYADVHPAGTHLYTVDRVSGGVVTAYRIDETGELTRLNRRSSEGAGPCYLSVDPAGDYVFVANYSGGTVAMLPIEADGTVGAATEVIEHGGSSVDPDSQAEPHPHSIGPGPNNDFVYVPDLGIDRIVIYRLDREADSLRPADPSYVTVADGAGPRHFDFHPSGRFAYVINELDSTLGAFRYDPETGYLDEVETVDTLPEGYDGDNFCADIHVHPSGDWVYGSNRGHDSIAIFEIDDGSGRLDPLGFESTRGHWPRHFALDPSGTYLLAENLRSDSIESFEIDDASGELTPTGNRFSLPGPICLQFLG